MQERAETDIVRLMQSDETIIRQVLAGDQRSFEVLVERYQDTVARFIWSIVPAHHDREEVCQDVFVKVYFKLETFRFDARFTTWLYQIAYRTAVSFNRRLRPEMTDIDELEIADADASVVDKEMQADTSLEQHQLKRLIDELLLGLKLEERTVVTLFYYQDMVIEDIALVVDRPAGSIKSILYRVRQKLEATIAQQMPALAEAL